MGGDIGLSPVVISPFWKKIELQVPNDPLETLERGIMGYSVYTTHGQLTMGTCHTCQIHDHNIIQYNHIIQTS